MEKKRAPFAKWLGNSNEITRLFLKAGQIPDMINLAGGLPEASVYPASELAEIAKQVINENPEETLGYCPIEGLPTLRDAIAKKFSKGNLKLSRENILIVTGAMQSLDLVGKVLLDDGARIAVQDPTYLGALDAWRPRHPTLVPMNIHGHIFNPASLLENTQFAYTVPNFSNPTGSLVSKECRQKLVDTSNDCGTWLVEDDPYGVLYYDSEPIPSMLEMSADENNERYEGNVIYMGTLSKEIAPGLRLGWIIAAPEMINALATAKQGSDLCTSGLSQQITLEAINTGLMEKILPNILTTYKSRRDALCAAMETYLTPYFTWEKPVGGMFVWAVAKDPRLNTDTLLEYALDHGVCVTPSSVFDPNGEYRKAIRINFTHNPPETLEQGIKRLAKAMKKMMN